MTARVGAAKKKKTKAKPLAKLSAFSNSTQFEAVSSDGKTFTYDTGEGWVIEFTDDQCVLSNDTNSQGKKKIAYFGTDSSQVTPSINVKYENGDGNNSLVTLKYPNDYTIDYGSNIARDGYGTITIKSVNKSGNFWNTKATSASKARQYSGGIIIRFQILRSVLAQSNGVKLKEHVDNPPKTENVLRSSGTHLVTADANGNLIADGSFEYDGAVTPDVYYLTGYETDGTTPKYQLLSNGNSETNVEYRDNNKITSNARIIAKIPSDKTQGTETVSIQFTIAPRSLTNNDEQTHTDLAGKGITVSGVSNKEFTGNPITQNIVVTDNGLSRTLTEATDKNGKKTTNTDEIKNGDYYVTYADNTNKGTATVTIHGVGNYTGTVTRNFTISPKQAVNSRGELDSEITMKPLSGVYSGDPVEPVPQITYSPKDSSGKQMKLKAGTDFDVTYTNNTAIKASDASDAPTAHIVFKGNYAGEFDYKFSITKSRINSDGATVSLDGKTATVSNKNNSADTSIVGSDDTFSTDYDPIDSEVPQFVVKVGNKTLAPEKDYTAYTIDNKTKTKTSKLNIEPTSGEHKWPSVTDNSWKWELTLTGQDNYSGAIKVQFSVDKLKLSDNSILLESATIGDDGNANVTLQYTSKQNSDKKTIIKAKENNITNFDIKVDTGKKAQKDATITLTGKGNYTGTKSVKASKGYDLSDENVTSTDYGSQIMILLFNPYTGELINGTQDRAHAMVYYGASVRPKVVLLRRIGGSAGNTTPTYRQLTEGTDYSVSAPTRVEGSYSSETNTWRYTIDVSADSDSSVLYNSKSKPRTITYYVGPLDLSKHTEPTKNNTNTGDLVSITPDNSALTSYSDIKTILGQVKLYVKPSNVGEPVKANFGDGAYKDLKNDVKWTAPNYWTSANNQQGESLAGGTDFTLSNLSTTKKTVDAHGVGNYTGDYTISLDQVDIGNSSDFEISPFTKDNPWNGQPVFPTVGLHQISTNNQIPGTNYYIIYKDKDGHRYVLSTYYDSNTQRSEITDQFDLTNFDSKGAETRPAKGVITSSSTQTDPIDGKTPNEASYFIGADKNYTVTIRMKTGSENTTKLSGEIGPETYAVSKQSVNAKINAYFRPDTITYQGFDKDGKANTKAPELSGNPETAAKSQQPKLWVKGTDENATKDLKKGTDYTIDRDASDDYFKYPGRKDINITGLGEYSGTSNVSYLVKGNLSNLCNSSYFDFSIGTTQPKAGERITIYTNGNGGFVTADGQDFSLSDISIGIPNTSETLQRGVDYELSQDTITSAGLQTIRITGKSEAYVNTSFNLLLNVVESRSGLTWSETNNETIELPWRENNPYKLGEGRLALKSSFSTGSVILRKGDETTTGDIISVNGKKSDTASPTFGDVGDYTVEIQGPPSTGQSSVLRISIKYDLSQASVNLGFDSPYAYDGTDPFDAQKVSVKIGNTTLSGSSDYVVDGGSHSANAGDYTVKISSTSRSKNFASDTDNPIEKSYTIVPVQFSSNITAQSIGSVGTYDGKEKTIDKSKFIGKVSYRRDDGTTVDPIKDSGTTFTVSYQGGLTNAGTRNYVLTLSGNYTGTCTGKFTIDPYNLEDHSSDLTIPNQTYQGATNPVHPQTINLKGFDPLKINQDYTIKSEDGNSVITDNATISIQGTGNFTGTVSNLKFKIEKLNIANAVVDTYDQTFSGNAIAPGRYVTAYIPVNGNTRGAELVYNDDYTISLTRTADGDGRPVNEVIQPDQVINAGTYSVVLTAKAGSKLLVGGTTTSAKTFVVAPLDISSMDSEFSVADAEWTGSEVSPAVLRNGTELDKNLYEVKYTNNTRACGSLEEMRAFDGAYSVGNLPTATITGKGNYTGVITKHFRIGHPFSNALVTVNGGTIRYDGSEHKPTFTIRYPGSNVDTSKVTYNTSYPSDAINAGSKTVTLTATGGALYGTKTFNYYIYPASGSTWIAEFTANSGLSMDSSGQYVTTYQGAPITPEVKAYLLGSNGTRTELPLQSGEITYANNNAAGTASVTIKPQNYEGTKVLYFKINGVDISQDNNVYVAFSDGITRRKYTGSAIQPAVTVTFAGNKGTVVLTQDRDYSLTYTNNTKAGAANVKITGIGNYSGSRDLPFNIWADLNDKTSTFTIPKQMYTGEPITTLQGATLKAGGNDLAAGTDYTLSITSTDAYRTKGTAIFTAQGPYYEGTRTVQFDIGNDASMYNVIGVASSYVFDHQAHKPVPVVTDKQGQVYETNSVVYSNTSDGDACINAGNVRMTISITSHGQTVSIPYNYTIESKNINTATFTPLSDVNYNGKAHRPSVRITEGTRLLTGTSTYNDGSADYVVSYFNNTLPGKAQVVVTGINNYTGTANLYFDINVKSAPQMIVTAMPSGRLKVTWKKVSGVSGYRVFYTPTNGTQRQVNVSGSKKSTYLTGLTRGVVYTVGVQSYITANGVNGYSSASVQQIATSTSKPTITSAKSTGKGRIKITWKKVSNATAYMVYRKTSGSSKWTRVKTTKSTSFTNTGLKSGTRYTYKVISYKQSGVKRSFSKYSNGRTVRAK